MQAGEGTFVNSVTLTASNPNAVVDWLALIWIKYPSGQTMALICMYGRVAHATFLIF